MTSIEKVCHKTLLKYERERQREKIKQFVNYVVKHKSF